MVLYVEPRVEKPEGSEARESELKEADDMLIDMIYIDSEPDESEDTVMKIKEEVQEMISYSDNDSDDFDLLDTIIG